jgi:GR25 family glycosyltransferase involved in LPS biosynthesis
MVILSEINTLYINLECREDRKIHVQKQLENVGIININIRRFNAIQLQNNPSALGCSMSHLKCLQIAKESRWPHVLICEDDIEFLDPSTFTNQLSEFLSIQSCWDVILLAGNNMLPYSCKTEYSIKVHNCLTTTGYIVAAHYYDILINNYKAGIQLLMKNPELPHLYAIDKYWISLQKLDAWFLIIPLTVVQREDYSDIEKKNTNFKKYMLDYNKVIK